MKILVIGSGGREHTIIWKLSREKRVSKIYAAPGNGGISKIAENVDIKVDDIPGLVEFAKDNEIDLTVVGPELPLSLGIVDEFNKAGLKIFGVDKKCSQLESSKEFSKNFMKKYQVPTARYESFTNAEKAIKALEDFDYPVVIKADGLCAGKGVIIAEDRKEAVEAIEDILVDKIFGEEGSKIVIEEFLKGIEMSLLCLVSNNKIYPLEPAEDYKQIYDGDKGPNTGGVGCYSPSKLLDSKMEKIIDEEVIKKIEEGFEAEGFNFNGVLFIGFMIDGDTPNVLEFNVRFGDPESQVVIPRIKSSFLDLLLKTIDGTLEAEDIKWEDSPAMTVILTSEGYPGTPRLGDEITGLEDLDENILVFHNGTKVEGDKVYTAGGRVLSITSTDNHGKTMEEIREKVYENVKKIHFDGMHYRKDIAKDVDY